MLVVDAAREAAEEVRKTYWSPYQFPVDPFAIAEAMGIDIYRIRLEEGISGMVSARADHGQGLTAAIAVEARDAAVRQAFTCAHELGHYVERSERGGDPAKPFAFVDRRTSASDIHEFYANEFAGNLLMPELELRRQIEENHLSAIELAGYFGVSLPAMNVRLRRLGLDQPVES